MGLGDSDQVGGQKDCPIGYLSRPGLRWAALLPDCWYKNINGNEDEGFVLQQEMRVHGTFLPDLLQVQVITWQMSDSNFFWLSYSSLSASPQIHAPVT